MVTRTVFTSYLRCLIVSFVNIIITINYYYYYYYFTAPLGRRKLWLDASRNQQHFASKQAEWLEQELDLHIKCTTKLMKQTVKCHAYQVHVVFKNIEDVDVGWCHVSVCACVGRMCCVCVCVGGVVCVCVCVVCVVCVCVVCVCVCGVRGVCCVCVCVCVVSLAALRVLLWSGLAVSVFGYTWRRVLGTRLIHFLNNGRQLINFLNNGQQLIHFLYNGTQLIHFLYNGT
jgi:hypothetical protein